MDQNSAGFMYLKNKVPKASDAKIQEGVFRWTSNKGVNTGQKIWESSKWSRKSSMEIIQKCHYLYIYIQSVPGGMC